MVPKSVISAFLYHSSQAQHDIILTYLSTIYARDSWSVTQNTEQHQIFGFNYNMLLGHRGLSSNNIVQSQEQVTHLVRIGTHWYCASMQHGLARQVQMIFVLIIPNSNIVRKWQFLWSSTHYNFLTNGVSVKVLIPPSPDAIDYTGQFVQAWKLISHLNSSCDGGLSCRIAHAFLS